MAANSVSDPAPGARLVIKTSNCGDIDIELWTKQAPLASRSFIQHALDGYYDGTSFHRLVPGFILQGGDPTGSGYGGEAAYDGMDDEAFGEDYSFPVETHSRIKFTRRGLLGMAASEDSGRCRSQFFFTLGTQGAPELNGNMTCFGRVAAGDSIYNVVKMGDAQITEGTERPIYPTKITSIEVLDDPFNLSQRRKRVPTQASSTLPAKRKVKHKAPKAKPTALSFAISEDEDTNFIIPAKKPKRAVHPAPRSGMPGSDSIPPVGDLTARDISPEADQPDRSSIETGPAREAAGQVAPEPNASRIGKSKIPLEPQAIPAAPKTTSITDINAEIAHLKKRLRSDVRSLIAPSSSPPKSRQNGDSLLERMIGGTGETSRGRKRGAMDSSRLHESDSGRKAEESKSLAALIAFKQRLDDYAPKGKAKQAILMGERGEYDVPAGTTGDGGEIGPAAMAKASDTDAFNEEPLCDLHFIPISACESCKKADLLDEQNATHNPRTSGDDENEDEKDWIFHRLRFAKDQRGKDLEWKKQRDYEDGLITMEGNEQGGRKQGKKGGELAGKGSWQQRRRKQEGESGGEGRHKIVRL